MSNRDDRAPGEARHAASRQEVRAARRHELGHPQVTEFEIGNRTHRVAEDVQPLDMDGVLTMIVGTVLWGVAAVAMMPFLGTLDAAGRGWWMWTTVAGFGLGLIGIEYCLLRRAALR